MGKEIQFIVERADLAADALRDQENPVTDKPMIWRTPRSSPTRRIAMWSKFHLYWTGMNGSGNTGRTSHRRAYSNLDAGACWRLPAGASVPAHWLATLRKTVLAMAAAQIRELPRQSLAEPIA
jgi:hypothetical protein